MDVWRGVSGGGVVRVFCIGWAEASVQPPPGGILLRGAGATFPPCCIRDGLPYEPARPEVAPAYDAVGSGEGVGRFIGNGIKEEDRVDFGASDAAMTDEQMTQVSKGALLAPATAGSVVLAYNLPNFKGELKLSRDALAGIFLGRIKVGTTRPIAAADPGVTLPWLRMFVTVARQMLAEPRSHLPSAWMPSSPEWSSRYGAATLIDWPGNTMRGLGNERVTGLVSVRKAPSATWVMNSPARLGLQMALLQNKAGSFVRPGERTQHGRTLDTARIPANLRLFIADPAGADAYGS